jgi:segregation and condensation protein B
MSAAPRRRRNSEDILDVDLIDLPPAARWREWMLRIEAAIFASAKPVPREALVRVVGNDCRFDDLIADLIHELRGRPYDLVQVAGGYALRTKTRFAPAIRAVHPERAKDAVGELTKTETFALTAIAYLQPVTREEISKLAGRKISRDVIGALKRHGLIDGAIRAPQPGAPFAYVTTKKFLEAFGLATLRDLPDLERLKAEGRTAQPDPRAHIAAWSTPDGAQPAARWIGGHRRSPDDPDGAGESCRSTSRCDAGQGPHSSWGASVATVALPIRRKAICPRRVAMRSRRSGDNRVQIDAGRSLIAGSEPTRQGGQRFEPDSRRFVGVNL